MAIDFQLIEAHDVDIENFSYDVSDMVNSIYIGPQGELLEKLESFNHQYHTNIGITKSFTLKPGGYDQIKQAHARWVLRYDMKPRGINSIFDRIGQYNWRLQSFRQQIMAIDTRMKDLKQSGMRWQDNTDQFEEEYDRVKTNIINSLNQTREMYPSVDIRCKVIPVSQGRLASIRGRNYYHNRQSFPPTMFSAEICEFVVMFYIKVKDMDMMVHVMDGENSSSEYRVPMSDVYIASGTYLLPLISRHWGRTTPMTGTPPNNSYSFFLEALYLSEAHKSMHPYISSSYDKYAWDLKAYCCSNNICTGNMENDIRNSLLNNEIMAHIVQLITWVTNYYVPQTNPLNRIHKIRKYGDDIKFVQWRNDLNNTSAEVFRVNRNEDMPNSCGFGMRVYDSMIDYAKNKFNNDPYTRRTNHFSSDSAEYVLRLEEYLNRVDLKDMPCNNCSFKSECEQWNAIQLIFKDDLTPEEEAYFGILYECYDFDTNIMHSADNYEHREIHFAEISVHEAWRYSIDADYLKMMMAHKMCVWWAYINNEPFNAYSTRYKSRMRELHAKGMRHFKHLFEHHYLNEASDLVWTMDNIIAYRAPSSDARLDEPLIERATRRQREIADANQTADNTVETWFNAAEEEMTPEQRSIQWAIQNGGANNL